MPYSGAMRNVRGNGQRQRWITAGLTAATALGGFGIVGPHASAAPTSVPPRTAFETNRIDSPVTAALPDGRVLVGWFNGTNSGDTTLAMVRPSGGLLPNAPQVLRTGYSGEDLTFTTGGPANDPVITAWQDGDSRTPFRVKLDGGLFTTQSPIFSGTYGRGRFPSYARCPDGSTVFTYQYTYDGPPASYASMARLANADGSSVAGSTSFASSPDYYQDPTVTCDRGVPLFSVAVAGADQQGAGLPQRLGVRQLGPGGGTLLDTLTIAPHAGVSAPDARVAADGRVWILWTESPVNPSSAAKTYLATRAPGATGLATFSTTPFFSAPDAYVSELFFDAAGNTHVLIDRETGGNRSYGIRTAPAGSATFGPEQPLLSAGQHYVRLLTDHPDGNPRLLVTKQGAAPGYVSSYALRGIPQAGSGDAVTPIDFSGIGFPAATFLPTGDLFLAGVRDVAPTRAQLVEGGVDTGAPPTIDAVDVPGLAVAGQPTPISLDARDPLGLSAFGWTISGGSLSSPVALSTQRATIPPLPPGTYEVRARAVDRAGGVAEVVRTLRALDPTAVPPGPGGSGEPGPKAGGSLDRTPPRFSKLTATRGRSGKAKRSVSVSITASEPAAANFELIGTARRGGQKGTLILKSATVKQLAIGKARTAKLAIPAKLTKLVGGKLRVRATLTDQGGNRAQRTIGVKTVKAKKAKKAKKK